jgi:predicted Abi (CAAX) family protease
MIKISNIILLLVSHFIGDFLFQSTFMANYKSKSFIVLGLHAFLYMTPFLVFFGWKFAILNGILHFCVDGITSRFTSKLWAKKEQHWFFVVIGFDQLIHYTILLLTLGI